MNANQPVQFASMRGHRFHLLDGLRGVAAILVVLYHLPPTYRPRLPMREGFLAVDFFFLLSGFVIAFSYESRLQNGTRLRDFVVARLIRLYPLYLAGTLLGIVSVVIVDSFSAHVHLSISDLVWSLPAALLMIPNFMNHWPLPYCFPFDAPAWSLFLEVLANVLFAVLLVRRLGNSIFVALLAGASLIVLLVSAYFGSQSLDCGPMLPSLPLGLARVGLSFFLGVLIFRMFRSRSALFVDFPIRWLFPAITGVGLVAALLVTSRITQTFAYQILIVALLFPMLLFLGACSHLPPFADRVCAFLGDVSYPLYILHAAFIFPLGGSKPAAFLMRHATAAPWLLLLVYVCLIALSWFAARYPDRSIRLWLTRRYNAATPRTTP